MDNQYKDYSDYEQYEQFFDETDLQNIKFDTDFLIRVGSIEIPGFDYILEQAKMIRNAMKNIVVTTKEDAKVNKKLVAKVNKAFNEIDTRRKELKKEYMRPYLEIDKKCKELKEIITEANDSVRVQIRAIEERDRIEKKAEIEVIFNKRLAKYEIEPIFDFEDFFKEQYLNTTYSIRKIEKEMTEWLESQKQNVKGLEVFCESNDYDLSEALVYYKENQNVVSTMMCLDSKRKKQEELEEKFSKVMAEETEEPEEQEAQELWNGFWVKQKDFDLVINFLQAHDIEYQIIEE